MLDVGVFITARLRGERFTMAHEPELALLDTDPVVQATIFGRTFDAAETHDRVVRRVALWDERGHGDYVVRLTDGTFIGCGGVFPAGRDGTVAIGYALRPAYWGRGYATEIAGALTRIARALPASEILASVLPDNHRSRRVLEKVGFECSGRDPEDPETFQYRFRV